MLNIGHTWGYAFISIVDYQLRQLRIVQRSSINNLSAGLPQHYTDWNTSLCSASSLGCQHDTARICCWAQSPDIDRYLLPATRSAANPPHAAAAVDWRDIQTDGRTDARTL